MSKVLLEMKEINKRFPGAQALDGVDFTVERGEIHALLGENGAGKSTLMKILAGVLSKDGGHIFFEGKEILRKAHPKDSLKAGISMIFQEFSLFPRLTVAENICLDPFGWKPISKKKQNKRAEAVLSTLSVDIPLETPVGNLSTAQQQIVEIAKALSRESKLLVMDEPTSALNTEEVESLFSLLRRLAGKGISVVIVTHRLKEVFKISEKVTVLRDGKKVGTVVTKDTTSEELITMMVGRRVDPSSKRNTGSSEETVLEVRSLTKKDLFGGVNFSLKRGEVLGVAGLMGSGRTEVAKALFGAIGVDSGEIVFKGKQVAFSSPREAIKAGLAYLPEDRKREGLVLDMDIKSNITLPIVDLLKKGFLLDFKKETDIASKYQKDLSIRTPSVFRKAKFLSGGNQQKVVLAKWLASNCDVLILDEPTRGIDIGAKEEIYELINKLSTIGKSIIVISSELPEILRVSDRILVMWNGKVAGILGREEATEEKIMRLATGHIDDVVPENKALLRTV